jgi:hypothetical protein
MPRGSSTIIVAAICNSSSYLFVFLVPGLSLFMDAAEGMKFLGSAVLVNCSRPSSSSLGNLPIARLSRRLTCRSPDTIVTI